MGVALLKFQITFLTRSVTLNCNRYSPNICQIMTIYDRKIDEFNF